MNISNETSNKRNSVGKGHGVKAHRDSFYRRLHELPDTTDARPTYSRLAEQQRLQREAQAIARGKPK